MNRLKLIILILFLFVPVALAQDDPERTDTETNFLKVPLRCKNGEVELAGAVYSESGPHAPGTFFHNRYYQPFQDSEHLRYVRLFDENGEMTKTRNGKFSHAGFTVDCEKRGSEIFYAYVPYDPTTYPVSLQLLDNNYNQLSHKICIAALNPNQDGPSNLYLSDTSVWSQKICKSGWMRRSARDYPQRVKQWFDVGVVYPMSTSYRTGEPGAWLQVWRYNHGNCKNDDLVFVNEYDMETKYPIGEVFPHNTMLSISDPFYGDPGPPKVLGGGKYCNGMWNPPGG